MRTTEQAKRNHSDEPNENGREEEEEEKGEKERGAATSTGRGLGAAPILRQQDRGKRSTGLGLRGALLPQDGGGSGGSGESSWSRNTYPLGERNLVPHQEDTETKRSAVSHAMINSLHRFLRSSLGLLTRLCILHHSTPYHTHHILPH